MQFIKKIIVSYLPVGILSCMQELINQSLLMSKKSAEVNRNWIKV